MSEERRPKVDHDTPPFSRLFVVCSKNHEEDDIRRAFEEYGTLQDVWLVNDRTTQERKGICYIKFDKASSAHKALEKLHGEAIGCDTKPLKVLLADSKGQNRSVAGETKPLSRLFILISRSATEEEVKAEFSQFGNIDHVQILTDRATGDSKGCAYVKFVKPSAAFAALEECAAKYKAVIAEPRVPKESRNSIGGIGRGFDARDNLSNRNQDQSRRSRSHSQSYPSEQQPQSMETITFTDLTDQDAMQRLYIVCHTSLYEEQLYSLFDIIPGLDTFELKYFRGSTESRGFAYASYMTVELACFAKRKLDGLEYPPGHKLIVKYAEDKPNARNNQMGAGMDGDNSWNAASVSGMRQQVLTRGHSINLDNSQNISMDNGNGDCPYTSVSLPKQAPMAASDTPVCAKLFIVGTPSLPDIQALNNVFCRFASLIDIQLIAGTSYGYIHYGMKESAEAAAMVMNNCKICGNTVKLSSQDDGSENKRSRVAYENTRTWN